MPRSKAIETPEFPDAGFLILQHWEPTEDFRRPLSPIAGATRYYMFTLHTSKRHRDAYVAEYMDRPDVRRRTHGKPVIVGVQRDLLREVRSSGNGVYKDAWSL